MHAPRQMMQMRTLARALTNRTAAAAASSASASVSVPAVRRSVLRTHAAAAAAAHRQISTCPHAASTSASASACPVSKSPSNSKSFVNPYATAQSLSAEEIATIKSTVPVLAEHGVTLTTRFYKKMFAKHPELGNVFNSAHQASGMQPKALASAVYAYAANIDNLGALGSAVKLMSHKHASLSILPAQYEVVGSNLLETLNELLTEAGFPKATVDTIVATWAKAYGQLANILIQAEEQLYREAESVPGGWRGWRKFKVKSKTVESHGGANITSFEMVPQDGGKLPAYLPGQYTTVRVELPASGSIGACTQPRQYTLSKASDGRSFRITVKREDPRAPAAAVCPISGAAESNSPAGRVSTHLHSTLQEGSIVELAPPFGEFHLDPKASTPVVLIAGGVGLTPMLAMAEAATTGGRGVTFLYAVQSGAHHPMKKWLQMQGKANFAARVWYQQPEAADKLGDDYHAAGMMNLADVPKDQLLQTGADYYLCGPTGFMSTQIAALKSMGVPQEKIHAEVFGTGLTQ